ncbi:uroporphyrinogen-III synthase [Mammaliicoccus stepanovicii]|uniref:Uroporphyrinogen-III synthase n=1 Tax=Mammaliicoccus stepanovicii TaxID=643214 RepID=A0A239Z3I4_9STAP|nr:uroporphyrinogen-III synthase [Mammaliicoccus stepanovicii]PNZ78070.1 uroporphyrinogen-III synthase [Mammaliicoccus stepanovicii]GGI40279.1 uroporphyrinogen III methyltransferase [Mammaliicoccus stepanovicii]SNV65088.1 uroporphyrinogen III synthase [Mammaliicoccus stepanovicii]
MKPIVVLTSTRTVQREDVDIKHYPFIDIVPIKFDQSCLKSHYDWLIFTSVNAIKLFEPYMHLVNAKHVAAIGSETKKMANKLNIPIDLVPETYTQEGLLSEIKSNLQQHSILIPCSKKARNKLSNQLESWGNDVHKLAIYEPRTNLENVQKVHQLIKNKEVTHVTFSSPSAVSGYFEIFGNITEVCVYAIGNITQEKLNTYHQSSQLARVATLDDMINTILKEEV